MKYPPKMHSMFPKKGQITKLNKQYETMRKAQLELTEKKNKVDRCKTQHMGLMAGETWLKGELVNWKIELMKLPRTQHKEISKWRT